MVPVLGYWDFRGFAEQIRLFLRYLGVEFEEKVYKAGPDFDRSMWLSEKFNLGLKYPNLPYYIDGDLKLTQSLAILEYIADEHGMVPDCKKQRATLHMIHNSILDLRFSFIMMCYNPDFDNQKEQFLKRIHDTLKIFEEELGDNIWLTGDKINYPDFSLCELLNQLEKFEPSYLSDFPKLKAYLTRFENLPAIKDYMASKEFKTRACWSAYAKWSGEN
ncbi:hypothetical protein Aperf_G00000056607 [Anoplocephala perfoliata]